jgi:hypothetical protein
MQDKETMWLTTKDEQTQMSLGTYTFKTTCIMKSIFAKNKWTPCDPLLRKQKDRPHHISRFSQNNASHGMIKSKLYLMARKWWCTNIIAPYDLEKTMMLYIRRIGDATYKSTHKNNYNVKEEVMNNRNEKTKMTLTL